MAKLELKIESNIAQVILTNPARMNAVDMALLEALASAAREIKLRQDVRAVILHAEGPSFCAGLDKSLFGNSQNRDGEKNPLQDALLNRPFEGMNLFQWSVMCWRRLEMPVIAVLHGHVLGAGAQLAFGADMRIAAKDTKFSIMEMKWGLVPDMGGMVLFGENIRGDILRRMIYTAEISDAETCLANGVVTEIAEDPLARAFELASQIVDASPSAISAAKDLLGKTVNPSMSEAELLQAETAAQLGLIGQPHQMEVISAMQEKRRPRFD